MAEIPGFRYDAETNRYYRIARGSASSNMTPSERRMKEEARVLHQQKKLTEYLNKCVYPPIHVDRNNVEEGQRGKSAMASFAYRKKEKRLESLLNSYPCVIQLTFNYSTCIPLYQPDEYLFMDGNQYLILKNHENGWVERQVIFPSASSGPLRHLHYSCFSSHLIFTNETTVFVYDQSHLQCIRTEEISNVIMITGHDGFLYLSNGNEIFVMRLQGSCVSVQSVYSVHEDLCISAMLFSSLDDHLVVALSGGSIIRIEYHPKINQFVVKPVCKCEDTIKHFYKTPSTDILALSSRGKVYVLDMQAASISCLLDFTLIVPGIDFSQLEVMMADRLLYVLIRELKWVIVWDVAMPSQPLTAWTFTDQITGIFETSTTSVKFITKSVS